MRRFCVLAAISLLVPVSVNAQELKVPDGFAPLFNGKNLDGWHGMNPHSVVKLDDHQKEAAIIKQQKDFVAHWSVENGELVNDGKGPYCSTDKVYGDYELLVEYKTVAKADSGIYLKGNPQVQIWDYTDEGKFNIGGDKGSGGLWNNSAGAPGKDPVTSNGKPADKPFGEWNSFRIVQIGARTSVWLNGQHVVDHALMENYWDRSQPLRRRGVVRLQTHGNEIRWRNIFIREIGTKEANEMLASAHTDGFQPIFNGTDFTGWQGATDNYEVDNGAIRCRKGKGGNLFTEKEYSDFVVRLEFKLPPAGNNGLAIRYPGKGNPAYDAMTELQVLDSEDKRYANLDKLGRQYHGSAYGMMAAKRGYLRKVGEWNFQEVTVKGSTIKVELNGSVIMDGDLSKARNFMANSPHPGKDRKSGFFGFAGHNDPVEFRNISIKEL
ncbi:MAG: DUF1080 domain-containing protein [Planctomycetaceae bacterium]